MHSFQKRLVWAGLASSIALNAFAQGTAFTYQGKLNVGSNPATGLYDLQFGIFDSPSGGIQQGALITNSATPVSNGLFTVTLDFGNQFPGTNRWLDISARTNGAATFETLAPRQEFTSTPYAVQAANASSAGSVQAGNIVGTIPLAELPTALVTNGASGVNFTGTFTGNGAGITNVVFGSLNSGGLISWRGNFTPFETISDNVISSVVATNIIVPTNVVAPPELLCANATSNSVDVFTNNGSGGFGLAFRAATANASPFWLSVADLNGDGRLDVVVGALGTNLLTVLTNDGHGGLELSSSPAVQTGQYCVIAADINGDGKPDLIAANTFSNTLSVLTNNGTGGFVLSSTPVVGNEPAQIVAADINGDGKLDLMCANVQDDTISVLTNNGSGGFVLAQTVPVGKTPAPLATMDVNGDGKLDLICGNLGDNTLTVLTNNGSGGFTVASTNSVGANPSALQVVNLSGDGRMELVCGDEGDGAIQVLTNNGAGGLGIADVTTLAAGPQISAAMAFADINGDGKPDLISASGPNGPVFLLLSSPTYDGVFSGNGSGLTSLNASNITSGTVPASALAGAYTNAVSFSDASGNFFGNGLGLQNLNASQLTSGTVPGSALNGTDGSGLVNLSFSQITHGVVPASALSGTYSLALTLNNASNSFTGNGGGLTNLNASQLSSIGNINGSFGNFFVGPSGNATMTGVKNTAIGQQALNVNASGNDNTAEGYGGLYDNTGGSDNTANGFAALGFNTTGSSNTAVGVQALLQNVSGSGNTADGWGALYNNTSGSNNIALGSQAGFNISTGSSNIDIGNPGVATDTNIIRVGSGQTQTFIAGVIQGNGGRLTNLNISVAELPASVVMNGATGVNLSGTFSGNGAGVTNVNLETVNSDGSITWPGNFVLASSPGVGAGPQSVVAADVNGDGKVDLISANNSVNTLSVLTNNGNGGFVLASSPIVPGGPISVVAADVNGDGKMDLISANYAGGYLAVLTNDGSGGFVVASSLPVGNGIYQPYSVTAADINGDGRVDLISANLPNVAAPGTLSVFTNDGSGGFVLASSPTVGDSPLSVTSADINGDGKVALISANFGDRTLSVLTNNGSAGFVLAYTLAVGSGPDSVVAADVNGDGKVDLICANSGGTLSVLTNNGSGGFAPASSPTVGRDPTSVTVADVNGDGKLDLICANGSDNTLTVLTNIGGGTFALAATISVGDEPSSVTTADVNGDGKVDLISANSGNNTLSVLFNEPVFTGSGSGLTSLNASQLTSGTVPGSALGGTYSGAVTFNNVIDSFTGSFSGNGSGLTNVALLIGGNTFTGNQIVTNGNLGIGTTNPGLNTVQINPTNEYANGYGLVVCGTNYGEDVQINASHATGGGGIAMVVDDAAPGDSTTALLLIRNNVNSANPTNIMTVTADGTVRMSGNCYALAFNPPSDRNIKENFQPISSAQVLAKVSALPIQEWNFKVDTATRHIGPMAQDFFAAFRVGTDDKHIATVDEDGVALAAIQGLNEKVEAENQKLEEENAELKARLEKLERLVNAQKDGQ